MPEVASPPTPEAQKGPSTAELLRLFEDTEDVTMAQKIGDKIRGQQVTVRDKDGSEQEGWSVRGVNYVLGDERHPGGWQVVLGGKKKEVGADGKSRFPRRYVFASELADWQPTLDNTPDAISNPTSETTPDDANPEDTSVDTPEEIKQELTQEEIEELAREDAKNRELDEKLLSGSARLEVAVSDMSLKSMDWLANNWAKVKTAVVNHRQISPVLGMRKHAYDKAKESYFAKKARAEAAESKWVKSIRERGVQKAEKKLERKRTALKNHVAPMNDRVVHDKVEAHKRAKETQESHNFQVRDIMNKKAEAELRRAARNTLRDEGYGVRERRAAVELLMSDKDVKADVLRAGRIVIEHSQSERLSNKISRRQNRFSNRIEKLNYDHETTVNRMVSLKKAIEATDQSIEDTAENLQNAKKEVLRLHSVRRHATINDNIEQLNRDIAAAREHASMLEKRLADYKEHRNKLEKPLKESESQSNELEQKLQVAQEKDAAFDVNVAKPQEASTDEVKQRRDTALEDLVITRKEKS